MINISWEPIYEMLSQFLVIVVIFSMVGILYKQLSKSLIGLVLILSVLFIGVKLQPSTFVYVFLSVLQMAP